MSVLPSARSILTDEELLKASFFKPKVGRDLENVLSSSILSVRLLTLHSNTVVPFHFHKNKEEIYVPKGPICPKVTMLIDGILRTFVLENGKEFLIPRDCPHCVQFFTETSLLSCRMLVIVSSQDDTDVVWEDSVDELIENKHRL